MFELEIKANEEIESFREKYGMDTTQLFILKIFKFKEIADVSYESMKHHFIKINKERILNETPKN